MADLATDEAVRIARRYFAGFAGDYRRAFAGGGRDPLQRLVSRLFRRRTFARRTAVVRTWLAEYGVTGKRVLDLGCGSGEVALVAAALGARVHGLDVVPAMVDLAREEALARGAAAVTFDVADITRAELPASEVTLLVSVLEYYPDARAVLARAAGVTGELLVLVDTRGPLWRRTLRHALARLKGFRIFYRSPAAFGAILERSGFVEWRRLRGHSFWALAYRRVRPLEAAPPAPTACEARAAAAHA